ncbi:MAG: aldo/keto reductase [Planctomycetaceae bacterium]|nr:aldo/keto reductase [Planctomycetaceae bacterium]
MQYRYLGNSGLLVSRICLGTMTFGMSGWGCDQQEATAITNRFLDAGGNFIDTADMYSAGVSEEMLGNTIAGHKRDDLVLATKCWFRMGTSPNAKGLSRKHVIEAVDESLRRLQTDYIDLFQVHGPDPHTPLEETLRALDDQVRAGKIRYLGCSNYFAWQIVKANGISDQKQWERFVSAQHMYNLLRRDVEREILPACLDQGMGMLCWSPLAGGMLCGKYDKSEGPSKDSRVGMRANIDLPRYWNDESFEVIHELIQIAREVEHTPSQVALAWLLKNRGVTAVIAGARTEQQIEGSLAAGDWSLSDELFQRLADKVPFALGYPQDWIDITQSNVESDSVDQQ